jgi:hypothetical protein
MGIGRPVEDDEDRPPREPAPDKINLESVLTEHNVPRLKKMLREIDPEAAAGLKKNASGQYVKELLERAIALKEFAQAEG